MNYLLTRNEGHYAETTEVESWDLLQLLAQRPWEGLEEGEKLTITREDYEA